MLPYHDATTRPLVDMATMDDLIHAANATMNSIEFLTAIALGLAHDRCETAANEGVCLLNSTSPAEATAYLSISPIKVLVDISRNFLQLQEAARNYFDYVDTDLKTIH